MYGNYMEAYGYLIMNANAFGDTHSVPNLVK